MASPALAPAPSPRPRVSVSAIITVALAILSFVVGFSFRNGADTATLDSQKDQINHKVNTDRFEEFAHGLNTRLDQIDRHLDQIDRRIDMDRK
jgi:hypothetical protein